MEARARASLTTTDGLPARVDASRLCISVGGITMGMKAGEGLHQVTVTGDVVSFVVDDAPMDVELSVRLGKIPHRTEAPAFDSKGTWRLFRHDGRDVFHVLAVTPHGPVPYAELSLDPGDRTGEVVLDRSSFAEDESFEAIPYPLPELLAVRLLGAGRGVELHACGVVDEGGAGFLFAGHSGDGKTTMARLWMDRPGVTVLSDDRIIVRRERGQFWMYGTPWHGEARLASNRRVPLTAVFFLERGARNRLYSVSPASAAAMLFARSFPPFYDASMLEFVAGFLGECGSEVRCSRLAFVPDPRICTHVKESCTVGTGIERTGPGEEFSLQSRSGEVEAAIDGGGPHE